MPQLDRNDAAVVAGRSHFRRGLIRNPPRFAPNSTCRNLIDLTAPSIVRRHKCAERVMGCAKARRPGRSRRFNDENCLLRQRNLEGPFLPPAVAKARHNTRNNTLEFIATSGAKCTTPPATSRSSATWPTLRAKSRRPAGSILLSDDQSQCLFPCPLLEGSALAEPCRVKAVIVASRSAMVIDELRDAVYQPPRCAAGGD
jgi:hypothetical protein